MPFRLMTRSVSVSLKIAAGRTIFVTDAHRDDGKRFVVRADEKLTAFLDLETASCACGELVSQVGEIFAKLGVAKRI